MLEITELSTGYGRVQVLQQVSLSAKKGEIVALIGSNGAGKSTLLQTVAGIHRPKLFGSTVGSVRFCGKEVLRDSAPALVRQGLVLVPERRQIWPDMSVGDHLKLGAFLRRKDRHHVAEREAFCVSMFPRLKERFNQVAGTLSGGEQQMLAMARALMANPEILLLDEPSTGLSPVMVARILEAVQQLREHSGITILLVEQMVTLTLQIADRAYVLDRGRIVLSGVARDLLEDPAIKESYLGGQ